MEGCRTKYPIILVHGLGVTDTGGLYVPWGRIPAALRAGGASVYFGGQDAWGSIETGAAQLGCTVQRVLRETGSARVNLIAHSKGGLEARYLISSMGCGRYVASLSMLATPNRGARTAELLLHARPGAQLWARRNDAWWAQHGEEKPDSLRAGEQLTPKYLAQFNRDNPDANCVYYQSWGTEIGAVHTDGFMMLTHGLFYPAQGASDGLVTPASARWGRYRGTLEGVSHQQLVDAFGKDAPGFSAPKFYTGLVQELAGMGF